MPEQLRKSLIVPVQIPAWSLICGIVVGAFGFGVLYNQLNELVKDRDRVNVMYERQIKNIESVDRHERVLADHQQRISQLERGK